MTIEATFQPAPGEPHDVRGSPAGGELDGEPDAAAVRGPASLEASAAADEAADSRDGALDSQFERLRDDIRRLEARTVPRDGARQSEVDARK